MKAHSKAGILLFFLLAATKLFSLSVTTFNVRNFDYDERANIKTDKVELKKILQEAKADIFVFQEIVYGKRFSNFFKRAMSGHTLILTDCGGRGGQKVGIAYDKKKYTMETFYEDENFSMRPGCVAGYRPAALGYFKRKDDNKKFMVVGLHLKAGSDSRSLEIRGQQYDILAKLIKRLRSTGRKNIILAGDLNTTEYINQDSKTQHYLNTINNNELKDFAAETPCTNYWAGTKRRKELEPSILDHVIISNELFREITDYSVKVGSHCKANNCMPATKLELGQSYNKVSDHCPVTVNLKGF